MSDHPVADWAIKNLLVIGAWWGSVTLGQIQTIVGIACGLAVTVYTILNTIKLVRELRRKP